MGIKVGITGPVGSIKSEALAKVMEMLQNDGKVIEGTLMSEKSEHGKLYSYFITDILTKKKIEFARYDLVSRVKVDKLGVDTKALEELLIPSLEKALEEADIIVIDELGKIENATKNIKNEIEKVMKSEKEIIITLHKKSRNPVLQEFRAYESVRVFDITPINKNILPFKIVKVLNGEEESI
ncbi:MULTISPECIES: NTPase [Acidiplasma]|jgi:nucleoside-triphosphatase|uniref:Nucleoside-triphosphatase AOG55_08480 n=2 Tax=Acidiplasma TaxID=507753 RepID=A0A0Q0RHZ8_9ARCH|nr:MULTISPECIES: NTPase [Acidiplasma]KJE49237.1 nucleoside triphosphatase [Acidiplasma sp. MBA-1]KPV46531.1 nucleoside triphosphatase [Acidiplasma aeolicum]KQB34594.1 nucleoside triphosphatase [Acidiplasma aeolicum]KQB34953.1 nucleoside triphosphatase [Acidiplasma cupricumulans]WMT54797.1 MAG: NTPase [Acidiplasma sp.]